MLSAEEAERRLAQWRLEKTSDRIVPALEPLPEPLRHLGFALYDKFSDDHSANVPDPDLWLERSQQAAVEFCALSPADRARIFEIVAPGLAASLEGAWQILLVGPYQGGRGCKAYRSPGHPEIASLRLPLWMRDVANWAKAFPAEVLTPAWLAAWWPHTAHQHTWGTAAPLLAAALNQRNDEAEEVYEILRASLHGEHEIGLPGVHVYAALLMASDARGWELMERTLLAAQRQEGLRQAILEVADMSHPLAFRRLLRVVLDENLLRFSATVRAVDTWLGGLWRSDDVAEIREVLTHLSRLLDDHEAQSAALRGNDAQMVYFALTSLAMNDAHASIKPAVDRLGDARSELRFVAAKHLSNLDLPQSRAALLPVFDDPDLRIAALALGAAGDTYRQAPSLPEQTVDDRFERLERLLVRVPEKPPELAPLVWPWAEVSLSRAAVAERLPVCLQDRSPHLILKHLPAMSPWMRLFAVRRLHERGHWTDDARLATLELCGASSEAVRVGALNLLENADVRPTADEALGLERLLSRKVSDLRRGLIQLLLRQADDAVLNSARRLLSAKDGQMRRAGWELLRELAGSQRAPSDCRQLADATFAARSVTPEERVHFEAIVAHCEAHGTTTPTLENGLGLFDPAARTALVNPTARAVATLTPAALACLVSLDELIYQHREVEIEWRQHGTPRRELLGNVSWGFPSPSYRPGVPRSLERLPLADVWRSWFQGRGLELRDADGFELLRARAWLTMQRERVWFYTRADEERYQATVSDAYPHGQKMDVEVKLRFGNLLSELLAWLFYLDPPEAHDFLLDCAETAGALLFAADEKVSRTARQDPDSEEFDWRSIPGYMVWDKLLDELVRLGSSPLTRAQVARRWQLARWFEQPTASTPRRRCQSSTLLQAFEHGAANLTDISDALLGPQDEDLFAGAQFSLLSNCTVLTPPEPYRGFLAKYPEVADRVDAARERLLAIELARGDLPTPATLPARALKSLWGIETLVRILAALGKDELKLGGSWHQTGPDRRESLTRLIRITFPRPEDTPKEFVRLVGSALAAGRFPEERLRQLLFLTPQWLPHLEAYFGWPHIREGVYWFIAHMSTIGGLGEQAAFAETASQASTDGAEEPSATDPDTDAEQGFAKTRSAWQRLINERTPLSAADRAEGAIDTAWFHRVYSQVGKKRWEVLALSARFAATPAQAKRAQFVAQVLLGKVKPRELILGIRQKQLKESVRLLGLAPLAKGAKRAADLRERCLALEEYRGYANRLSGLTKPSAVRAWEIGLRNLATLAGYPDPLRLQWAVDTERLKDLANGPVTVSLGEINVTLSLNDLADAELTIVKAGKVLKSLPATVKKAPSVAAVTARVSELRRQTAAARRSLEAAMCRGDRLSGRELGEWWAHPLLASLLARLVLVGEGISGYPSERGRALRDFAGRLEPVKPDEPLRIAHPHDLWSADHWHDWQRECFLAERVQPFKQVFRELYPLTARERDNGLVSERYSGHQVQPQQALALFGQRGWHTDVGIYKTFHDEQLTASLDFLYAPGTAQDVEAPTLTGVSFFLREDLRQLPLDQVPPRLFSEVMRDLDLVVGVAHTGRVDPEASASTIELRTSLLQETCSLLGLKNVRIQGNHALIDGQHGDYSLHLGSGSVHRLPGGAICIVPIHAQHRGRLFLPFADQDPQTAEILSKALLLSKDGEIKDPSILSQLRP